MVTSPTTLNGRTVPAPRNKRGQAKRTLPVGHRPVFDRRRDVGQRRAFDGRWPRQPGCSGVCQRSVQGQGLHFPCGLKHQLLGRCETRFLPFEASSNMALGTDVSYGSMGSLKDFVGVQMPNTLMFDYPSVKALTQFIDVGLKDAHEQGQR